MRRDKNPIQDLRTMAFAGAMMFVSAAVLTIVALILPHRPGPDPLVDIVTSAVALACAGLLVAVRNRLRMWFFHVLIQIGNVLIAGGMYAGGPLKRSSSTPFCTYGVPFTRLTSSLGVQQSFTHFWEASPTVSSC